MAGGDSEKHTQKESTDFGQGGDGPTQEQAEVTFLKAPKQHTCASIWDFSAIVVASVQVASRE